MLPNDIALDIDSNGNAEIVTNTNECIKLPNKYQYLHELQLLFAGLGEELEVKLPKKIKLWINITKVM